MDYMNGGLLGAADSESGNGPGLNANGTSLPIGFTMALAMNEKAMNRYSGMTEAQKEEIILRAKDAKSKKEMERLVSSLAVSDEQEVNDILQ